MTHFVRMVWVMVVVWSSWRFLVGCDAAPQDALVDSPASQREALGFSLLFILPPALPTPVKGGEYAPSRVGYIPAGGDRTISDSMFSVPVENAKLHSDIVKVETALDENSDREGELEAHMESGGVELTEGDKALESEQLAQLARSSHRGDGDRQFFSQNTNRFINNGNGSESGGSSSGLVQNNRIVGSNPGVAVSMVQSFVEDITTRPMGERPGYIMINSPNPSIIQQLVSALTQRYGSSSVIQEPGAIQNLVNNSPDTGGSRIQSHPQGTSSSSSGLPAFPVAAAGSEHNGNTAPMFPYDSYWSLKEGTPNNQDSGDSEADYIRRRLASVAHITVSTGKLANDTVVNETLISDAVTSDAVDNYTLVDLTDSSTIPPPAITLNLTTVDATQFTVTTIIPAEGEIDSKDPVRNAILDFAGSGADTPNNIVWSTTSAATQMNKVHHPETELENLSNQHTGIRNTATQHHNTDTYHHITDSSTTSEQFSFQSSTDSFEATSSQDASTEGLVLLNNGDDLLDDYMKVIEPSHHTGDNMDAPKMPYTSLPIHTNIINPSGIYINNVFHPGEILPGTVQQESDNTVADLSENKQQTYSPWRDVENSTTFSTDPTVRLTNIQVNATTNRPATYTSTVNFSDGVTNSVPFLDHALFTSENPQININLSDESVSGSEYSVKGSIIEEHEWENDNLSDDSVSGSEYSVKDSVIEEHEWENEVSTTGYEDYYEEIDGELVLSPSKFMRRGGPQMIDPSDYNIYEDYHLGEDKTPVKLHSHTEDQPLTRGQDTGQVSHAFNKFTSTSEYSPSLVNIPLLSENNPTYSTMNSQVAPDSDPGRLNELLNFGERHSIQHFEHVNSDKDVATKSDQRIDYAHNPGEYGTHYNFESFKTPPHALHPPIITAQSPMIHQPYQAVRDKTDHTINPHTLEELWRTNSEDLSSLELLQAMDSIPVVYDKHKNSDENVITGVPSLLKSISPDILDHLRHMNVEDLETLGLLKHMKSLAPGQASNFSPVSKDHLKLLSLNQGLRQLSDRESPSTSGSTDSSSLEVPVRSNFSHENYRQSNPAQRLPPNFFPTRPTDPPEGIHHHEADHSPQLTPEQQGLISRLPAGMQHVVSAIVQAVHAPSVTPSTTAPPQQPFQFSYPPYPYLPYPYYPPPPLGYPYPPVSAPHASQGGDASHLHYATHTLHGNHGALENHHGTHHSTHGHGAHSGHGVLAGNHAAQDHGTHSDHSTHHAHSNHGSQSLHGTNNLHRHNHHHHDHNADGNDSIATTARPLSPHHTPENATRRPGTPSRTPGSGTRQPVAPNRASDSTPQPAVVTSAVPTLNPAIGASRLGEFDASEVEDIAETGIRDNDNRQGSVNRIGPGQPDRNQGLLNLRQDASQMGHGRPSGSGIVNYRPPQQSQMHMGQPVVNVVLPEAPSGNQDSPAEEEDIGPLIEPTDDQDGAQTDNNNTPQLGMDREEANSLLQSLFSSPTLLLLGIIFATSAAYMAIAMEEQSAQQQFQQAQLAAAFGGQPFFPPGRRKRSRRTSDRQSDSFLEWYPRLPHLVNR